jgi:hypothetical protein
MSAEKKENSVDLVALSLRRIVKTLRFLLIRREGRLTLVGLALLGLLSAGPYGVWQMVGDRVLAGPDYRLTPDNIEIDPPLESVAWIRRDVKAEALRDASLDRPLSILEDDLGRRIAQAFSLHPWIERVESVTKQYPAHVRVKLVVRRPMAVVEAAADGGLTRWPVDVEGFVLPHEDFSPLEMQRYPQIAGISTAPLGPVGTRWGDARVVGGARIAAAFGDGWKKLNLARIVARQPTHSGRGSSSANSSEPSSTNDAADESDEPYFELMTKLGTRIHWGRAPGSPIPGEMSAEEKIARLLEYADRNNSLDEPNDGHELDLRERGKLLPVRRARATNGPSPR